MKSRSTLLLMLAAVMLFVAAPCLMAQEAGGVTGTITNPGGKPVPGVTVTLTNNATGESMPVQATTASGTFTFISVPPGDYKIAFSGRGFVPLQISSFTVNVSETPVINRSLKAGAQTAAPVVEARAENLPTTQGTSTGANTVNTTEIPLATRNFTQATSQNAGATASLPNATQMGRNDTDMNAGGASTSQNAYSQDGTPVKTWFSGGGAAEGGALPTLGTPSPDAIQEVKVDTTNIDAAFDLPGAHTNVILRSGGSAWHGSMFEFFRNTALNSNEYFRELVCNNTTLCAGSPSKLILNQNQFGATAGGPIKKDKLYLFLSYQQTWQKNGFSTGNGGTYSPNVVIPYLPAGNRSTAAWVNSLCNYYNIPASITGGTGYIKGSSEPMSCNGQTASANGTGFGVDGTNLNPVAYSMLQAQLPNGSYLLSGQQSSPAITCAAPTADIGLAITTAGCTAASSYGQNANYSIPGYTPMYQGIFNFDYYLTKNNVLAGRYSKQDEGLLGSFAQGTAGGANPLPGVPLNAHPNYTDYLVRVTSILSTHTVNEVRFAWQIHNADTVTVSPASWNASSIYSPTNVPSSQLLTAYGTNSITPGCGMVACVLPFAPQLLITNFYSTGCAGCDSSLHGPQFSAADTVSWSHGRHSVRFGMEYDRFGETYKYYGLGRGIMIFSSFPDFLIGGAGCAPISATCNGGSVSNINSTTSNSFATGPGGGIHHYHVFSYSGYIQDDIKVKKSLTVNIGMRWEYNSDFIDMGGSNTNLLPKDILLNPQPVTTQLYAIGQYYGYNVPGGFQCVAPKCVPPPAGSSYFGFVVPGNFNTGGVGTPPSGVINSGRPGVFANTQPLDNFGPRLGFAWSPLKNNKMIWRAGVGYFYDRNGGTGQNRPSQGPPTGRFLDQGTATNGFASEQAPFQQSGVGTFPVRWINPTYWAANTGSTNNSALDSSNLSAYGNDFIVSPLTYTWNTSIQYQVAPTWVATVGYTGSHGIHQFASQSLVNGDMVASPTNPIVLSNGSGGTVTITNNTTQNASLRVPYLGFGPSGIMMSESELNYKFNQLQASLNHRLSHGVSVNVAYSYSRAFIQSTGFNNPNTIVYIPNSSYRPQRLIIRYSWNLPGEHLHGLPGKVLGGWQVAGVTTVQDGSPLTFTDSRGGTLYGISSTSSAQLSGTPGVALATTGPITSRLGGSLACLPVNPCPSGYVNAGYFGTIPAAAGQTLLGYGNSGPGILLGPGQFNFDASLTKTMTVGGLRENAKLAFRTEFYNMFNHPQFSNPNAGVNGSSLGNITATAVNPRLIQFGLRYVW